jgi:signal transduction histidine kinase
MNNISAKQEGTTASQYKFINWAKAYSIGAVSVATALLLNLLLAKWIDPGAPLFLAAIAITAWRAGIYPSLAATALAVLANDYFFQPPLNAFEISLENAVNAVVFIFVALLISYIERARFYALAERERLLVNERHTRAEAEEASRAKDTFLAMVTHELRSPLNAVLGWTQMMRRKNLDEVQTERALAIIERNVKTQAQLIEDLLDISHIRTGKFRINLRPVDLCPVIDAAIESVMPAISAKRIRLQRNFDNQVGFVNGDTERLQQIVWNLLSNAVKFTPEGGQIDISLEHSGSHARLKVHDNGEGIRGDFLPFVFDSFRQSNETDNAKHKGLGLGLAIVRHLVEAHGGTVAAASAGETLGATFTVELPLMATGHYFEQLEIKNGANLEYV